MATNLLQISNIPLRIITLADYFKHEKDMRNNAFLEMCGLNKSYLANLKSGQITNPSSGDVGKIVLATNCSLRWLFFGEGEMFDLRDIPEPTVCNFINQYSLKKKLSPEDRANLLQFLADDAKKDLTKSNQNGFKK